MKRLNSNPIEVTSAHASSKLWELVEDLRSVFGQNGAADPGLDLVQAVADGYFSGDEVIISPALSEFHNVGIQVEFTGFAGTESIVITATNTPHEPSNSTVTSTISAGGAAQQHFIDFNDFSAKYLSIKFVGFSQGTLSSLTILGKR